MKKKKWRDVKNALVMVVVMAAMMSTATYAWFTLTSNATVTGMQMTAGGSSGLKVSETGADGTYADAITLAPETVDGVPEENQIINQLTVDQPDGDGVFAVKFYPPEYGTLAGGGTGVVGVEDPITDVNEIPKYAAKYTYFLKTEAESSATVGLVIGEMPSYSATTGLDANNMPVAAGSFVRATAQDTNSAIYAVRIGLVVDGKMYIYEPNSEAGFASDKQAEVDPGMTYTGYTSTVKSNTDGTITGTEDTDFVILDDGTTASMGLFEVTSAGTQVDMYVWLEGTDPQCADDIKADEIEAQVQFTIIN